MSEKGWRLTGISGALRPGPSCTVIICTRNRPEQLRSCIAALKKQTTQGFRILVVENNEASTATKSIAAGFGTDYLLCTKIGLSFARNAGLRACSAEFAAFIDDDATPDRNWLENLLCEFTDPAIMAVTGWCIYEPASPSLPHAPRRCCVDKNTTDWFAMANFGGIGDGGNMAFRRAAIDVWPGFDERLGRGALLSDSEEHYAFFSLIDRGYKVAHTPMALIRHPAAAFCLPNPSPSKSGSSRISAALKLRPVAMSTAYMTLLMIEHPRYCLRVLRFVWEGIRRTKRAWGNQSQEVFSSSSPRWQIYLALLTGPLVYFYMRLRHPFAKRRTTSWKHNSEALNPLLRNAPLVPVEEGNCVLESVSKDNLGKRIV